MIKIKHRFSETTLYEFDVKTIKEAIELAVSEGIILNGARLDNASLDGAHLVGARLDGASLVGASLVGARLDNASLVDARLDGARLVGARLDNASLVDARLDGASLDNASLVGARLVNANLVGARLDGARLDDARLDGARLDGASLVGARLDGEILTKVPLLISGLHYRCLISNGYMRLGCKRFTHAAWEAFSDDEIRRMDSNALKFWTKWKSPLLAMCKAYAAQSEK